jgi:hypothetical protein
MKAVGSDQVGENLVSCTLGYSVGRRIAAIKQEIRSRLFTSGIGRGKIVAVYKQAPSQEPFFGANR